MVTESCVGCKFLYAEKAGYSDYSWAETYVRCALDKNSHLKAGCVQEPFDWNKDPDNWPATRDSRCEMYVPGVYVTLDVDRADGPADYSPDEQQIQAICKHAGRGRNGGRIDD